MTGRVFVDTNVLLYARDGSEPAKQPRARIWLEHLWRDMAGRTSMQVLSEYYFNVTRKTDEGMVIGAAQRISRTEALRVSTINNAYLTYEEKIKGSIEPGKLADFLILSQNILTVPEEQLRSTQPLATYVGGQKVFGKGEGF